MTHISYMIYYYYGPNDIRGAMREARAVNGYKTSLPCCMNAVGKELTVCFKE